MSHLVVIQSRVRDPAAVAAACRRLQLPAPVQGTAILYSGPVEGLIVQLPEWQYPVVIDTTSGSMRYDNFEGRWGLIDQLHKFTQMYAVEKAALEARRAGHSVSEQLLSDGTIRLQIMEHA